MSIISSEADSIYKSSAMPGHPDLMRLLYDSDDLREAYERGAERQPTDEEIEVGAKAFYKSMFCLSGATWEHESEGGKSILRKNLRTAIKAMQGKATEE